MSSYGNVTVTTAVTLIVAANTNRKEIEIVNNTQNSVIYIGTDTNVTASNGLPVYEYQSRGKSRGFGTYLGPIYGVVSSVEANVRYWETT